MKVSLAVLFLGCALVAYAEKQPYERYKTIVERQMFGQPPAGFDPTRSPTEVQKMTSAEEKQLTAEQQKLQSAVHFSVINELSNGETAVGFTDNSDPKQPKHYYLKVGESQDGWKVAEADPEKASMTLMKGEIELEMTLGDKSASEKSSGGAAAQAAQPRRSMLGGPGGLQSLRARREQRKQQEANQRAEAEKRAADAKAEADALAAERDAQQQAEREEQRKQLRAIQEELRKQREAAAAAAAREKEKKSDEGEKEDEE